MEGCIVGLIGGIIGSIIGLMGGIIGTYFSIKNTKTPAERRFMIRCSIGMWAALFLIILLNILGMIKIIPAWFGWSILVLFFILLTPAILWINKRQVLLRQQS